MEYHPISLNYDKMLNLLNIDSSRDYDVYDTDLTLQEVRNLIDDLIDIQQVMEARAVELENV